MAENKVVNFDELDEDLDVMDLVEEDEEVTEVVEKKGLFQRFKEMKTWKKVAVLGGATLVVTCGILGGKKVIKILAAKPEVVKELVEVGEDVVEVTNF